MRRVDSLRFDSNVENVKRRGALPPPMTSMMDLRTKTFFERVLSLKKVREFIFITKPKTHHE